MRHDDSAVMREASFVQEWLVSSFSFQVSSSTSEFQPSETNNLKRETCNLKRSNEIRFTVFSLNT